MLIGNVGADPQVKYLDQGVCVAQVRLATTERGYTLQNGTQVPDRTEWHTCIFWRKMGETVEKYVHKGDKLYVEGKIQSQNCRNYGGQHGVAISEASRTIRSPTFSPFSARHPTCCYPFRERRLPLLILFLLTIIF